MRIAHIVHTKVLKWIDDYRIKRMHFSKFGTNVKVFHGFRLGHTENLVLNDNIVLGENVFINAHGGVEIGSGSVLGPDVMIVSVNHIYESDDTLPFSENLSYEKVVIGQNCWIGGRVFICPGVTIGEGSVVAGGSVVTTSFPPCSVIGGNPAKLLKQRDETKYLSLKKEGHYCSFITRR